MLIHRERGLQLCLVSFSVRLINVFICLFPCLVNSIWDNLTNCCGWKESPLGFSLIVVSNFNSSRKKHLFLSFSSLTYFLLSVMH